MVVLVTCKNKEDPIKNESQEWSQCFPRYNPKGAICCHGNQSSNAIWPKTLCSQFPTQMMLQMKYDNNRRWDLDEIQTHPSFYSCPSNLQV